MRRSAKARDSWWGSVADFGVRSVALLVIALGLVSLSGCGRAMANSAEAASPSAARADGAKAVSNDGEFSFEQAPPPPPTPEAHADVSGDADIRVDRKAKGLGPGTPSPTEPSGPEAPRQPLLIYKAEVVIAVFDVEKNLDRVEALAKAAGGYLVSRQDRQIRVRVPATGFEQSLREVRKLGDVLGQQLNADDVTAEFHDLEIRLRNAEKVRERLEQLLLGAKNTAEALEVERELGRVTAQIEQYKGRLRLMRELVSFSTITVTFQPPDTPSVDPKFRLPFEWLDRLSLTHLLGL